MLNKIKSFFSEMLYAPSGTALAVFLTMLLLSIFNLINTTLLTSSNAWMLPVLLISFLVPFCIFRASRGGKKYLPTLHVSLPKKIHIPTIIFSTLFVILGSTLLKLLIFSGKYSAFPLYNVFFANRNGNIWRDIYFVLAFCITSPVLEGLFFRGAMIKEHDRRGRLTATLFSSFLFALLGFSAQELLPRLFLGALLCIVLYGTDSIAITISIHIAYNIFAVFIEPTLVSLKNVSANFELFAFILAIAAIIAAILLFSHLSRLYRKYSHDKFGKNFVRSTPRERTFWHLVELMLSLPAISCYVLFIVVTLITKI
ncbi:MAG: CPBP family intramembrane metalloprotease [Clostridia bacterium]|nr:CPBP family intramembrane metalloprotease [Clostridia bacterium]